MKNLKQSLCAKLLAGFLILLCAALFVTSVIGVTLFRQYGIYGKSRKEVQKDLEQAALTKYSVTALSNYLGHSDESLSDCFKYAIYEGTATDADGKEAALPDSNEKKSTLPDPDGLKKLAGNAEGEFPATAAVHTFRVGKDPDFVLADSIFDNAYISEFYDEIQWVDFENNQFCMVDGVSGLFIADRDMSDAADGEALPDEEAFLYRLSDDMWRRDAENGEWKTLYVTDSEGATRPFSRDAITVLDNQESAGVTIAPQTINYLSFSDRALQLSSRSTGTSYTVLSYADRNAGNGAAVSDTVKSSASDKADFFEQGDRFMQWAFRLRYIAVAMIPLSLLLALLAFLFLLSAAGHRERDCDRIVLRGLDRLPPDLFLALEILLIIILLSIGSTCAQSDNYPLLVMVGAFLLTAMVIPGLLFCMSAAVNFKTGGLWKRTLIRRLLAFLNSRRLLLKEASANISMKYRIWFFFGLFVILELAGILLFTYGDGAFLLLWAAEKVIFALLLLKILREFGELKHAGSVLAAGDLDYRVETAKMFTDFEQHGNHLNCIGSGLSEAVDERLRSERMKTELITNVSHDIKTPLTSIVSYTDLLARLDLENPQAKEYIEVLSRQSGRLKKLIEDLIEASKASSGTLKMEMEDVDAGVILQQAAGEFDERLRNRQIDYLITCSAEKPVVKADSRYLWRIFDNLLSNICKYAQPGTRAYIDLTETGEEVPDAGPAGSAHAHPADSARNGGRIMITFRNISEEPLHMSGEDLKARFVRGDRSRSSEGSGLGLSIADSLAELMGGALNLIVDGDLFKVELILNKAE